MRQDVRFCDGCDQQAGALEIVDQVVDAALETAEPLIRAARHTLTLSPSPEELWVDGDPVRLAQVFGNLLNNAVLCFIQHPDQLSLFAGGRVTWTDSDVTFTAAEVRDPARNLPRALLAGCAVVVGLYLLANLAYIVTLPLETIQGAPQNRVATVMMASALGRPTPFGAMGIDVTKTGPADGVILEGDIILKFNDRTIELINAGQAPFVEPDLGTHVAGAVSRGQLSAQRP